MKPDTPPGDFPAWLSLASDGVLVRLHVQPKASRSEVLGEYGEGKTARLKVRIAAPPVDGAANDEVIRFVAARLGISRSRIRISRGVASRSKDLLLIGVGPSEVIARLASVR